MRPARWGTRARAGPIARTTTARSCARSSASSCRCWPARAIYGRLTDRFGGRPPTPGGDPRRRPRRAARRRGPVTREGRLSALAGRARHLRGARARAIGRARDEEVIAELVAVKGLGMWSAQMFLMFHLERPDVLPVGDLGIRRAIERAYASTSSPRRPRSRRSPSPGARTGRSRADICGARCRTSRGR